jgi:hypothetical protein
VDDIISPGSITTTSNNNKNVVFNLVHSSRFWNNLHRVRSKLKGDQFLCVALLNLIKTILSLKLIAKY